jgi:hypothetical protein
MEKNMRTIKINLYKYNELSLQAQERALEYYSSINTDYNWFNSTLELWKENLEFIGFTNAKIYLSGFWNQGDGACFDADINFDILFEKYAKFANQNGMKKIQRALKKHRSWIYDYLCNETSYSITVINHRYSHESTRKIESSCYSTTKGVLSYIFSDFEGWLESFRKDLCCDIYKDLETEYEALSAREAVEETVRINGYEFTQNGKPA